MAGDGIFHYLRIVERGPYIIEPRFKPVVPELKARDGLAAPIEWIKFDLVPNYMKVVTGEAQGDAWSVKFHCVSIDEDSFNHRAIADFRPRGVVQAHDVGMAAPPITETFGKREVPLDRYFGLRLEPPTVSDYLETLIVPLSERVIRELY